MIGTRLKSNLFHTLVFTSKKQKYSMIICSSQKIVLRQEKSHFNIEVDTIIILSFLKVWKSSLSQTAMTTFFPFLVYKILSTLSVWRRLSRRSSNYATLIALEVEVISSCAQSVSRNSFLRCGAWLITYFCFSSYLFLLSSVSILNVSWFILNLQTGLLSMILCVSDFCHDASINLLL